MDIYNGYLDRQIKGMSDSSDNKAKTSRKRTRTESGLCVDEEELPLKKTKFVAGDGILNNKSGMDAPGKSPADSAYGSLLEKSPYVSYPSVGNISDTGPSSVSLGFSIQIKDDVTLAGEKPLLSHAELVEIFRTKYALLKEELDPKHCLADRLFAAHVLTSTEMERISEEQSRMRRADILIKSIVRSCKASYVGVGQIVWKAFKEEKLDYLLADSPYTSKEHSKEADQSEEKTDDFFMSELQFLAKGLEDNLEPRDIIDPLLVSGFLNFLDHEDIYVIQSRHDRVKRLVDLVKRAGKKNYNVFKKALNLANPELEKQLPSGKELSLALHQVPPDISNKSKLAVITFPISASNMELEIKTFGLRSVEDVEMSAVETNNGSLNLDLEEEAMEIGNASILSLEYSSVRIKLSALSANALTKFMEALQNPAKMQRLISRIFTQEQLKILEERKVHTMKCELRAADENILESKCKCRLSKEVIVNSFTYLEGQLQDVMCLIESFLTSTLLDKDSRKKLTALKYEKSLESTKAEIFLRLLLTLPNECVCFFEKHLKITGQSYLIDKLINNQKLENMNKTWAESNLVNKGSRNHIGSKDIRKNFTFLLKEIEPKVFVSCFENTDISIEDMIAPKPRRHRCDIFLHTLLKCGQPAIEKFHRELERQKMDFIISILSRKKSRNQTEDIRTNILNHYSAIVNEIEPTRLREKLVREAVFKAKEFDEISRVSSQRRQRVVWLLMKLLQRDPDCLSVFCDALTIAGYSDMAQLLTTSSEESMECPLLKSKEIQHRDKVSLADLTHTAEFEVSWKKELPIESGLQLSLHKEIYKKNETDTCRTEYTESWVSDHRSCFGSQGLWPKDQELSEEDTIRSLPSKPLDKTDTLNQEENNHASVIFYFTETYNEPKEISPSKPNILNSETNIMTTSVKNSCTQMEDNKLCKIAPNKCLVERTESGSYGVPSVGSSAARSPYNNDFEDVTPHPSPLHDAYQAKPYLPLSPGGSGGTTCDSFESDSSR